MNFRFKPPIDGVIGSIGSLFGLNKGKDKEGAIDVDEEGKTLYKMDNGQSLDLNLFNGRGAVVYIVLVCIWDVGLYAMHAIIIRTI